MPGVWRSDQAAPDQYGPHGLPGTRGDWWLSAAAIQRLDRDPASRLVTIVAPGGSGKSRLVGKWLARHPGRPWLWADLRTLSTETSLAQLVKSLEPPEDDYAVLVVSAVERLPPDDVADLVDELPDGIRLVLVGTGDPLPPGLDVELAGEIDRFGTDDLWWPPEVVREQVSRLTGVTVTDQQANDLTRLTDGWPAGIVILSGLMGRRGGVLGADRRSPEPEILDFVAGELSELPGDIREFVHRTAPLEHLDVGTCAALVPEMNAHALLIDVQRYGLLDPDSPFAVRQRYRPLVRAAARRALLADDGRAEQRIVSQAAEYALHQGRGQDAFERFLQSGNASEAFATLASAAADGLRGWEPVRLRTALVGLPPGAWADDPLRRLQVAHAAALIGDRFTAVETIRRTPVSLTEEPWWTPLATFATILAGGPGVGSPDRYEGEDLPDVLGICDPASLTASMHLLSARAALFGGHRHEVERHLNAGWAVENAHPPLYILLAGLGAEALSSARAGELSRAQMLAARARQLAEQAGLLENPMFAPAVLARIELLRARGMAAEALTELEAAYETLRAAEQFVGGDRSYTSAGQVLRAQLRLDLGDVDGAGIREVDDQLPGELVIARAVTQAKAALAKADVVTAERVLATLPATSIAGALQVRAALERQAPEVAQRVLEAWPAPGTLLDGLYRLLARAALALALDRRSEAGECIQAALAAAEPDGHVSVFLDARPALWPITIAVLKRLGTQNPWRKELARRLETARNEVDPGDAPVTRRERVVLEYLARPLTHVQIAAALFVSENTLKSHCRNLYRKLGVTSRADALAVARARGWLPPEPQGDVVLNLDVTPATAADVEL